MEDYTNNQEQNKSPDPDNVAPIPAANEPISTDQVSQPVVPAIQNTPEQPIVTKHKKSKKWLWLIIVLVVLLAVAGYLLVNKQNKTTNVGKKDIPLIKYGFNNNPLNEFYPSDASDGGPLPLQYQIFEGLVSFQDGTQIKPQIASSWYNPNSTTWVFNIKPNVYFHDGDKVTAQDVVYTWQQVSQNYPTYSAFLTNTIKDVKAINNSTVQITTNTQDPILLNRLANLYILDSKAPKGTPAWALGAGAYTVKPGTTPTSSNLDLIAFNKWNGGHIYTREVDYIFYPDTAKEVKDLEAGKLNLIDDIPTSEVNSKLSNNFKLFESPQLATNAIFFNTVNPTYPTANIKIRQAISLAIDNKAVLAKSGLLGSTITQIVPQALTGYNPAIKGISQNIAEATQLVKEAGYPNGVTINFAVGEPVAGAGQEIAKELKAIGININLKVETDEGQYYDNINSGKDQAWLEGSFSSLIDGSDLLAGIFVGVPTYTSPELQSQLQSADTAATTSDHIKYLQEASLTISKAYADVPINQLDDLNASAKGIVVPLTNYDSDLDAYFSAVYHN